MDGRYSGKQRVNDDASTRFRLLNNVVGAAYAPPVGVANWVWCGRFDVAAVFADACSDGCV